jgi:hypothetical protein
MILKAFSEYLRQVSADVPAVVLLSSWLREKLQRLPENNVERILHREISLFKSKKGFFLMIARSDSGRNLVEALYEFALSYDNHRFSKWVHGVKASDFNGLPG